MARGDFSVRDTRSAAGPISSRYRVASGGTSTIVAGEACRRNTTTATYAQLAADGDSNTRVWLGVAASDSDETTSADGNVWIFDNPNYVFKGRASTSSNLAQARRLTQVTLDVASGTNGRQTIDEDDTVNGTFIIKDFDALSGFVFFQFAILDGINAG